MQLASKNRTVHRELSRVHVPLNALSEPQHWAKVEHLLFCCPLQHDVQKF